MQGKAPTATATVGLNERFWLAIDGYAIAEVRQGARIRQRYRFIIITTKS